MVTRFFVHDALIFTLRLFLLLAVAFFLVVNVSAQEKDVADKSVVRKYSREKARQIKEAVGKAFSRTHNGIQQR